MFVVTLSREEPPRTRNPCHELLITGHKKVGTYKYWYKVFLWNAVVKDKFIDKHFSFNTGKPTFTTEVNTSSLDNYG